MKITIEESRRMIWLYVTLYEGCEEGCSGVCMRRGGAGRGTERITAGGGRRWIIGCIKGREDVAGD